jgi:hypothetical protein
MAIRRRRHKHGPEGRKKHTDELSAMLAPLEEQKPEAAGAPSPPASGNGDYHDATIRVDSKSVKMPERLLDEDEPRKGLRVFRVEPLVLVIVSLMLLFMAFIAWQITLMSPK